MVGFGNMGSGIFDGFRVDIYGSCFSQDQDRGLVAMASDRWRCIEHFYVFGVLTSNQASNDIGYSPVEHFPASGPRSSRRSFKGVIVGFRLSFDWLRNRLNPTYRIFTLPLRPLPSHPPGQSPAGSFRHCGSWG